MDETQTLYQNPYIAQQIVSNPALFAQMQENQRRQMMAQQLMQAGQQNQNPYATAGNSQGSLVVPQSPWLAAARAATQMLGGYEQGQAMNSQNKMLADALSGNNPNSPSAMYSQSDADAAASPDVKWNNPVPPSPPAINNPQQAQSDLYSQMAAAQGITPQQFAQGLMGNYPEALKAGFAALQNSPSLVGVRKNAEMQNTIQTGTVNGREGVPYWGSQVPGAAPVAQSATTPPTQAGQTLPPVAPFNPVMANPGMASTVNRAVAGTDPTTGNNMNVPPLPVQGNNGRSPAATAGMVGSTGLVTSTPQPSQGGAPVFGIDPVQKAADVAAATKTGENLAEANKGAATIDSRISNAKDMINRMLYGEDSKGNLLPGKDTSKGMAANATYGAYPETSMALHNSANDDTSAINGRFQQLNSNLFTQELPGLAQSLGGRADLPVINAIKDASAIPMNESPKAKILRLQGLLNTLDKVQQNAHNQVENISGNAPSQAAAKNTNYIIKNGVLVAQ